MPAEVKGRKKGSCGKLGERWGSSVEGMPEPPPVSLSQQPAQSRETSDQAGAGTRVTTFLLLLFSSPCAVPQWERNTTLTAPSFLLDINMGSRALLLPNR